MKKLTIEQQIQALKTGLQYVKSCDNPFVCVEVKLAISDIKYINLHCEVSDYIPLLTLENAQLVCKQQKLKMPYTKNRAGGWWPYGKKKERVAFINWMIKELNSQL